MREEEPDVFKLLLEFLSLESLSDFHPFLDKFVFQFADFSLCFHAVVGVLVRDFSEFDCELVEVSAEFAHFFGVFSDLGK